MLTEANAINRVETWKLSPVRIINTHARTHTRAWAGLDLLEVPEEHHVPPAAPDRKLPSTTSRLLFLLLLLHSDEQFFCFLLLLFQLAVASPSFVSTLSNVNFLSHRKCHICFRD